MVDFNRKPSRPPQTMTPVAINFVGEQDGLPERDLKLEIVRLFQAAQKVERAYLARADYGDGTGIHVVLCVKAVEDLPRLVSKVGFIFSSIFGSHEHLDILFIREDQELRLRQVCTSFYERVMLGKQLVRRPWWKFW